jgi:DNA-binding NarL/FixJ family response regulator
MTTRVLVVDDHPIFREGLVALLTSLNDMEVVATAADAETALAVVADNGVDVVLMDLSLPGMSGITATGQIAARPDAPAVLVVTMVDDDDTVLAAMRAGARGYVLKGATGDEIGAAVRAVAAGSAVFGAAIARQILAIAATPERTGTAARTAGLTDRESHVLRLLADGMSNTQIARDLHLSLKTVQNYVSRILDKLQLSDRTQAALLAQRMRNPQ